MHHSKFFMYCLASVCVVAYYIIFKMIWILDAYIFNDSQKNKTIEFMTSERNALRKNPLYT